MPAVAGAHGGLRNSLPAPASALDTVPREIRLEFSKAAELAFTRVDLIGPGGVVQLRQPGFADSTKRNIVAGIETPLRAGSYTVNWQVAGADGHPVRGTFAFSINAGAAGVALTPGNALTDTTTVHHDPATFPATAGFNAESPAYVAIRWLQFVTMLVLTGAVAFYLFVLGLLRRKQGSDSPVLAPAAARAASIGMYAATGLIFVAGVRLFAQSYAMHAPGQARWQSWPTESTSWAHLAGLAACSFSSSPAFQLHCSSRKTSKGRQSPRS